MPARPRLLLIDDDPAVLALLSRRLEGLGRFEVHTAVGGRAGLRRVPELQPDLVICDIDMPDLDGGSVAAALAEDPRWRDLPLVFLSALVSPGESREGHGQVGGWPMLSKREPVQAVVAAVERMMARYPRSARQDLEAAVAARVAELLEENARLAQAALSDALTGLPNRRAFLARAEAEEARWRRTGRGFSVVFADVDFFKAVNDTYGHACGDAVLVHVARVMASQVRQQDLLARWGGEEFILLAPDTDPEQAAALAEKVRAAVERSEVAFEGSVLQVRMTLGVAGISPGGNLEAAIDAADRALYLGKQEGRNRVVVSRPVSG